MMPQSTPRTHAGSERRRNVSASFDQPEDVFTARRRRRNAAAASSTNASIAVDNTLPPGAGVTGAACATTLIVPYMPLPGAPCGSQK